LTVGILKTKGFPECDPDWTTEDGIVATSESGAEDSTDVLLYSVQDIDDAKRLGDVTGTKGVLIDSGASVALST